MARDSLAPNLLSVLLGVAFLAARSVSGAELADPNFPTLAALTGNFSLGLPASVQWTPDGKSVLFLRSGPRSFVRDLYQFDAATGRETLLLTAGQILAGAAEHLSAEERARRERSRQTARGIAAYQLSEDGSKILFNLSGRLYWAERGGSKIAEIASERGFPLDARFSPDGASVACVRDRDLYVHDLLDGAERRLTTAAAPGLANGLSEFVAQEEMGRFEGYWWSPDSRTLLYQETDTSGVEHLHILDAANPLEPAQAWPYPRPGQKNASVRLGLVPAAGGQTRWLAWDSARWPYLCSVRWEKKTPLTLLVQNREQTEEAILRVDPQSGDVSTLLIEIDDAWLNLDQSVPRWLPDASGFLWSTERNGAPELELRDPDGALLRSLVPPGAGYRGLVSIDEAGKELVFSASADPTESQVYSLALDTPSNPVRLTHGPGKHRLVPSPDHQLFVHLGDSPEGRLPVRLIQRGGAEVARVHSAAEPPPWIPRVELTTVGSDPAFRASIVRPRNFDPARRYPVIEAVYGGPGAAVVTSASSAYLKQQWMADHGFIVVSFDGRGTPDRGRAWERAIRGDFIGIPLEDHVAALRDLGARYPELDISRVGIHGWSFGGYFAAMAVMRHPELYKVAVAGAPVADWLFYDTHYTERYLGLPDQAPEAYRVSSVLTYAPQLSRPLLLIHGTTDDNVYFLHSLRISDALLRAGKPFEFLPLANLTHMVSEPEISARVSERTMKFLLRSLAPPRP